MPLLPGKANIGRNITELREHGSRPRSDRQILAIALHTADVHPRADGGGLDLAVPKPRLPSNSIDSALRIARAAGGGTGFSSSDVPYFERSEISNVNRQPYGLSVGTGGGRNDIRNTNVGAGSYIIPADVVAGLGDGNSLAGGKVWDQMLSSMPWGIAAPRAGGHRGPPPAPHNAELAQGVIPGAQREPISPTLADGGETKEVPIVMADGEIALSPDDVLRIGQHYSPQRDLDRYPKSHNRIMNRAHRLLDIWVKHERGKNIKKLKGLRGPVGSKDANKGHI